MPKRPLAYDYSGASVDKVSNSAGEQTRLTQDHHYVSLHDVGYQVVKTERTCQAAALFHLGLHIQRRPIPSECIPSGTLDHEHASLALNDVQEPL